MAAIMQIPMATKPATENSADPFRAFLVSREGAMWTEADTAHVMAHVERIQALKLQVIERMRRER